jgi:hypothetical protein
MGRAWMENVVIVAYRGRMSRYVLGKTEKNHE